MPLVLTVLQRFRRSYNIRAAETQAPGREPGNLAGLAGEIPEKIELALGAAVIKEFLSG